MANNLKKIRKSLGLTQPVLAEKMGTTKNQLIKLEQGNRRLTQEWLEKAAVATGVAIENFVMEDFDQSRMAPPSEPVEIAARLARRRVLFAKDLFAQLSPERQERILADIRDAARLEGVELTPPAPQRPSDRTAK